MRTPDRKRQKRVCHINMLKAYNSREAAESLTTEGKSEAVFPVGVVCETSPSVEQENADLDGFWSLMHRFCLPGYQILKLLGICQMF